jgi:hypothetical protein
MPKYIGPYEIISCERENSHYTLTLPDELLKHRIHPTFHTKLLRPTILNDNERFPNREATFFYDFGDDPEREWLVDSIVDHKFTNNSIQFDVLWHTGETTREPLLHCKDLLALDTYLELYGVTRWRDLPRNQKVMDVMTTIMSSNRPPKKPPPPDPQRSGKPVPKGKGRAKAPTPEIDNQAEEVWQGMTFSEDEAPAYEGKRKRKQRLAEEAEEEWSRETADDHAKKEVWATARQADPSAEEINRFLSYRDDMNIDIDAEVNRQSVETSDASWPTSLWSASSEQFLHLPHDEGHSLGASSKVSKRRQSPSPFGCSHESRTSSRGHGNPFEAGPPPGRYRQSSADEENRLLREEVQHLRDYGREDQMRIHFLERQMATERQLGYAEGLAQATQIQLCSPTMDREYGRGCPPGRNYDNNHARDLHHATEESRRMYRNESRGQSASGTGPLGSGPSLSSSQHHPSRPPPPEISKAGQREPLRQAPLPPLPNEMVVKTKTNGWAEPKSIQPERLACIFPYWRGSSTRP